MQSSVASPPAKRPLPGIKPDQLAHLVHSMHLSGALAQVPVAHVEAVVYSLHVAGLLRPETLPAEAVFGAVTPERFAHLTHAMQLDGRLAGLTADQVRAVVHALRESGHRQVLSTEDATYNQAGLITWCSADSLREPRFREAYALGKATNSWQGLDVEWRVYVLCWAAARAARLEGDFVECGVNRGGYSRAVVHYIGFEHLAKRFYLLDTFCGIPDEMRSLAATATYHYDECFDAVRATFRDFANVHLVRGKVPGTLERVPSEKICYLSIDMNCAEPEIAAATFFWNKLVPGAAVVLDDYGCGHWYVRQKEAFDQFAAERGVPLLLLPTGQGLMIKP
jgi:hypothetical protein